MTRTYPHVTLAALLLAGGLAACGGTDATDAEFVAHAPSYDQAALVIDDGDAAAPTAALTSSDQAVSTEKCHPHLFSRTHEIVARLNRHTDKMFAHVRGLIARNHKLATGTTRTWEDVKDGVARKLTLTANADGTFSYELDLAPAAASPAYVKVASGTVGTTTDATSKVTTTTLAMAFDYDALHSVIAAEKAAGQLAIEGTVIHDPSKPAPGVQKKLTIGFTNFVPEEGDPHGPRTGSFTHLGEPGVGGSITFADSLILLCPANPSSLVADTQTVARWYKSATGINGRADAKATGGQIPAGDLWEGVACFSGKGRPVVQANEDAYWMMKLEDASGNTVRGSATETADGSAPPCDAAFGAVPALNNNATDFDFSKPVSFPGQW